MNTQDNKFTFNKKGFALSLACVGLLATAANADITGGGVVNSTGTTYYFLGATTGPAGDITVKNTTGDTLTLGSGGAVGIASGGAIVGSGTLGAFNAFTAGYDSAAGAFAVASSGAALSANLNLNVNTTKVALGQDGTSGEAGAFIFSGGGNLSLGNNTFGSVDFNNVRIQGGKNTFGNEGTISNLNINSSLVFKDSGTAFTLGNTGSITNFNIGQGVNLVAGTDSATGGIALDITNSGTIGTFDNKGVIGYSDSQSSITISNTGLIETFNNAGTIGSPTKDSAGTIGAAVSIKNNGAITKFSNTGLIRNATIDNNANGALPAGEIGEFTNDGTITGSVISGGFIGTFTNNSAITGSTFKGITFTDFVNAGTISNTYLGTDSGGGAGGVIASGGLITNTFSNTGKIDNTAINIQVNSSFSNDGVISPMSDTSGFLGYFTLQGAETAPTLTASNTGQISNVTFNVLNKTASFANTGGTLKNVTIQGKSGKTIGTDAIANFSNTGVISESLITELGITSFSNTGETASIDKTSLTKVNIGTLDNSGYITNSTLTSGSITLLNNSGTFDVINGGNNTITTINNASTGFITLRSGGVIDVETITNAGNITTKDTSATLVLNVKGDTFQAPKGGVQNTGTIHDAAFTIQDYVASFNNSGLMNNITLTDHASGGVIVNFQNTGSIVNTSAVFSVTNFTNTGYVDFIGPGSGAITIDAKTNGSNTPGSFVNTGKIEDLTGITANTAYTRFDNSGTITANGTSNFITIGGGSLDFINSGVVELEGGTGILSNSTSTTSSSRVTINNTGELRLKNRSGYHIDLTNGFGTANSKQSEGVVTIEKWYLTDIGSAEEFNTTGNGNLTDKVVIEGFTATEVIESTTGGTAGSGGATSGGTTTVTGYKNVDGRVKFNAGSIVIDPTKNAKMQIGGTYDLDKIVVNSGGASVDPLNGTIGAADSETGLHKAVVFANEQGKDDPRIVTINTLTVSDPVITIRGVDKYDANGYRVGVDEIVTEVEREVTDASGAVTIVKDTVTAKATGDGIIDAFTVGVDAARGAGAVAAKSSVTQTLTRNAFVGNVVSNAVNTALTTLNPLGRVSLNEDGEVDVSKLEKFAAVASDGTGYAYEKDTQVFVMPYFRSTSVKLETGDKLNGDTFGLVLGGQKVIAGNGGVVGLFLGYETGSADGSTTDIDDDTMYAGVTYFKTLGGTATYDYYLKGMLRAASTSSDLTRKTGGVSETASPDSISYGVQAAFGMNFYSGIHTITPEFSMSYDRIDLDGFTANVTYDDVSLNLPVAQLGVNWLAQFSNAVSTNLGAGFRYNLRDEFDSRLKLSEIGNGVAQKVSIDDFYFYLNAGVNFALTDSWDLSVIYTGDFASDSQANSGFVKVGYSW